MPQPSGFQLVKALEKIGFHDVPGGKGSHRKLSNGVRTVSPRQAALSLFDRPSLGLAMEGFGIRTDLIEGKR
jgi:hypothetical protein